MAADIRKQRLRGEAMRYGRVIITLQAAIIVYLLSAGTARAQSSIESEPATHLALGAYITAAFFDTSITSYCHGLGVCKEQNPLLRPIVDRRGVVVAMTIKGAEHAAISGLLLHYHKQHPRAVFWATIGLTAAQVYVDAANVRTLRGVR